MSAVRRSDTVAQEIIEDLHRGTYTCGDSLPAETELCRRFDVSRSTVRSALSRLQDLGLIERHQGAATRVIATQVAPVYVHSMTASGDLLNFAGPTTRHIQSMTPIVADEDLAGQLGDRPGRHWLHIGQTRHIGEEPIPAVWTDVYLAREYSDIAEELPNYPGLIYTLLEKRHGIIINEIRQSIVAAPLAAKHAQALQADEGEGALKLTRRYVDVNGACWIITVSTQRASTFKYDITLTRRGAGK